jgi:hypothetical protein
METEQEYTISISEVQAILTSLENVPFKYALDVYKSVEAVVRRGPITPNTTSEESD